MSDSEGSDSGAIPAADTVYTVGVEVAVPLTDNKLFKTVLVEGTGQTPPNGARASVHYVGTLASDGSKFDSSRDRGEPFEFTLGQGQVIKGWDSGVATMKTGEKCILRCLPDYAYGKNGSPPKIPADATLNFEVELLSWTKEEDVSEARDKSIMKRIEVQGKDYDHPDYESEVTINVAVSVNGKTTLRKSDWTFSVGDVELPVGLEKVLCSMKSGEECVATVNGRVVSQNDEAHGIIARQDVVYSVSLVAFKAVKTWEFKGAEKVEQGVKRKDQGNTFFASGDWARAVRKYKRGLEFVEYDYGLEGDAKADAKKVKVALISNLAQALINQREYREAITQCNKGLEADGCNVKLLFRRGKASNLLDEWEDAKRDLHKILDLDPANADAARELAAVEAKERQYDQQMKSRFSRLFA